MSDTPRADAIAALWTFPEDATVSIDAYRDLERELNASKREIAALIRGEFICSKCGLRRDVEQDDISPELRTW